MVVSKLWGRKVTADTYLYIVLVWFWFVLLFSYFLPLADRVNQTLNIFSCFRILVTNNV